MKWTKDLDLDTDWGCYHPHYRSAENACPTRRGNCAECRFCKVTMPAADFFRMLEQIRNNAQTTGKHLL